MIRIPSFINLVLPIFFKLGTQTIYSACYSTFFSSTFQFNNSRPRNSKLTNNRLLLLFAGRPQPEVRWMVNGVLVDDQYEHNTGDVIENRLLWPSIQRTDLNSIFTCQAINTQLVEPRENSYILDLHRKYSSIFVYSRFIYHN